MGSNTFEKRNVYDLFESIFNQTPENEEQNYEQSQIKSPYAASKSTAYENQTSAKNSDNPRKEQRKNTNAPKKSQKVNPPKKEKSKKTPSNKKTDKSPKSNTHHENPSVPKNTPSQPNVPEKPVAPSVPSAPTSSTPSVEIPVQKVDTTIDNGVAITNKNINENSNTSNNAAVVDTGMTETNNLIPGATNTLGINHGKESPIPSEPLNTVAGSNGTVKTTEKIKLNNNTIDGNMTKGNSNSGSKISPFTLLPIIIVGVVCAAFLIVRRKRRNSQNSTRDIENSFEEADTSINKESYTKSLLILPTTRKLRNENDNINIQIDNSFTSNFSGNEYYNHPSIYAPQGYKAYDYGNNYSSSINQQYSDNVSYNPTNSPIYPGTKSTTEYSTIYNEEDSKNSNGIISSLAANSHFLPGVGGEMPAEEWESSEVNVQPQSTEPQPQNENQNRYTYYIPQDLIYELMSDTLSEEDIKNTV